MLLSIRFYLDNYDSVNHSKICLFVTLDKKRSKISTGLSIPVKFWDKEREIAKSSYSLFSFVNNELSMIRKYCEFEYTQLSQNGIVNREKYINKVKEFIKKEERKTISVIEKSFYEYWDEFIDFSDVNQRVLPRVVNLYKRAKRYFQEFAPYISFNEIDENLLTTYKTHLFTVKNLQINGALPYFKNGLFVFLNWSLRNGYSNNLKFKLFKIHATEREYNVYLSLEEIDKINSLENLSIYLENARDWLNIMSFTGLRICDAKRLNASHINYDKNIIDIIAKKTNRRLNIPIIPQISKFIQKLIEGKTYVIPDQKLNNFYSVLGEKAGITDEIVVTTFKPHRSEYKVPKYKLIGNQCFRRTFATNSLKLNLQPALIMKITDHKSMESFEKYIGFTLQNAVNEVSEVWSKI